MLRVISSRLGIVEEALQANGVTLDSTFPMDLPHLPRTLGNDEVYSPHKQVARESLAKDHLKGALARWPKSRGRLK